MKQTKWKKVKKKGCFYLYKLDANKKTLQGFTFHEKYAKLVKLKDAQAYLWFAVFVVLELTLREHLLFIIVGMLGIMILANVAFYKFFVKNYKVETMALDSQELSDILKKRFRLYQRNFTLIALFVVVCRFITSTQGFSSFQVYAIYGISLTMMLTSIFFLIYYGKLKNQMSIKL